MSNDDLWGAEEETQSLPVRPPGRDNPGGQGMDDSWDGPSESGGRIGGMQRRRVLYAAGGLTLLAGAGTGVAWAAGLVGSSSGTHAQAGGSGGSPASTGSSPSGSPNRAPGAGASGSGSGTPSGEPSIPGTPVGSGTPTWPPPSPGVTPTFPPGTKVPTAPEWYADDGPMSIALTMDDGPDPVFTPQVLAILQQYKIKATFNMIGRQVGRNLALVREVSAAGHTITNHTWDHADLTKFTYSQVCAEIDRCNDALSSAGQHPTIFRAPYGNWSPAVFQACVANNLRPVGWTVDPKDWSKPGVPSIVANVMKHTRQHDIILEHDGGGDRSQTVAAMKIFIPQLLARGFHFIAM